MRTVCYTRVSTDEQARSGLGLDAQRERIAAEVERRGWDVVAEHTDDGLSGSTLDRPGIAAALRMLSEGDADVLLVAKLDRLSRSLADFAALMDTARRERWAIVALDLGVDMTTPAGEMMAGVMATFSQYERRLIGQRTADALAAKKAQGHRLGRPILLPAAVRAEIAAMRTRGDSLRTIAATLNDTGTPTAQGGARWHASTVAAVLRSLEVDAA